MLSPFVGGEIDPNRSGRLGGNFSGIGGPDPLAFAEFDCRPAPTGSARLCPGGNPGFVPTHHQPPPQGDVRGGVIDQTTAGNGDLLSAGARMFGDPAGSPGNDPIAPRLIDKSYYSLLCYYGIQTIEMRGQRDAYTLDLRQRIVAAYQAGEQSGK